MREQLFKPKVPKRVAVPNDLKDFFQYVQSLIESRDNAAITAGDDLIQGNCACGGLTEEGTDQYAFTYFPGPDTEPNWEIQATANEMAGLTGEAASLDMWACANPSCGNLFSGPDGVCFDCDYIDDERDARKAIMPELVNSQSREEWVRGYLKHFPNDHWGRIIGAYNEQLNIGEKLGYFTTQEIEQIIADTQR